MARKTKNWVKDNRFLIRLSVLLSIGVLITFFLGKSPVENFFANLASEIAGALISLWIIDGLIQRHKEHSLRDVRHLLADTIRLAVYETISRSISVIADPEYDIVNLSEYNGLLHSILERKTKAALVHIETLKVKTSYPPLAPTAYTETRNMAYEQQREWTDFQTRFLSYLSPNQFATCARIIDRLRDIYKNSEEVDKSLKRKNETEMSLLASQLASKLVDEIKGLARECLSLLEITQEVTT